MKKLIVIKIGGSLIADKNKVYKINHQAVNAVVTQLAEFWQKQNNYQLIIANGAGSFGHYTVLTYKLHKLKLSLTKKQRQGVGVVHNKVAYLNNFLVAKLQSKNIPIVSFDPLSFLHQTKTSVFFSKPLITALSMGLNISFYGDLILTENKQAVVYSTEKLIQIFIEEILNIKEFQVAKTIFVTKVAGVLDKQNQVVKVIDHKNKNTQDIFVFNVENDVSGGMKTKLQTAITLAGYGIRTYICSADNLSRCLLDLKGEYTTVV
ncbi:MAG: uridylate kinase [Patescibacteria group bacterium]|nr:MAG: uridylate kinase [Patescibacteria group bacterium]